MADYYLLTRAHITADYITAQYAGELYDQAGSRPEADLRGDLETGFYFWTLSDSGLRLIHCRVTPLHTDQLPDAAPDHTDTPPGTTLNAAHPLPTESPWRGLLSCPRRDSNARHPLQELAVSSCSFELKVLACPRTPLVP